MKYYAVTDDPNELMHFGIKGMKWGIRRTDAQLGHPRHTGSKRPRSAAYKKASAKLSSMMKNGIAKAETKWKVYKSPENVAKRAAKRYAKQTEKAIEKARKGKLKYGKLDDWQVQRITERLAMENNARRLSETEKRFGRKLRESISEGIIGGIGQGFGRMASERISRGSTLKTDRMRIEQQHRMDREYEKQKASDARANAKMKAKTKVEEEYYEEAAKRGYNPYISAIKAGRLPALQTSGERARQMQAWAAQNAKEAERAKRRNAYFDARVKTIATQRAKNLYPESKNTASNGQSTPAIPTLSTNTTPIPIYGANGQVIGYGRKRQGK